LVEVVRKPWATLLLRAAANGWDFLNPPGLALQPSSGLYQLKSENQELLRSEAK
jgi:hypothetical protein